MAQQFEVTKTQRAAGAAWSDFPVHDVITVKDLAEVGDGIAWMSSGHGTYSGSKNLDRIDLATYIARPISR